jgi:hypothetical protein
VTYKQRMIHTSVINLPSAKRRLTRQGRQGVDVRRKYSYPALHTQVLNLVEYCWPVRQRGAASSRRLPATTCMDHPTSIRMNLPAGHPSTGVRQAHA